MPGPRSPRPSPVTVPCSSTGSASSGLGWPTPWRRSTQAGSCTAKSTGQHPAVLGAPGFLAPEQARGEEAGPAADVVALGCVLAYVTTGRRPLGSGTSAGVLFHTVHEDPDLDGVPDDLLPLVRACLANRPVHRPTPDEISGRLTEPAYGRCSPNGQPAPWRSRTRLPVPRLRNSGATGQRPPPPPRPGVPGRRLGVAGALAAAATAG
ncbi:hypothetical protein [Streptomyces sp. NPDC058486]|uniref:protein kinase domain-containing protein n=1 Tax=unclassified Streptomyces TaxID=2593676 RepID=UPI00365EEC03